MIDEANILAIPAGLTLATLLRNIPNKNSLNKKWSELILNIHTSEGRGLWQGTLRNFNDGEREREQKQKEQKFPTPGIEPGSAG